MSDLLFPEPKTPRTGALGWVEPAVHWFTEITRPEAVASRANVNAWYMEFPGPDGAFAARPRSEIDADHYQSLDELFLHHQPRERWNDVWYEEFGVGPDFRVYDSGGVYVAGIEVASLFQQEDWDADQRRHGRLADAVKLRSLRRRDT